MPPLLQAALNGSRTRAEHSGIPRTPAELAAAARAAVDAGAEVVHVHAYDRAGVESLAPAPCAAALRAIRAACPGVPVSLTTSAAVEPDPGRRLELVAGWTELPELVTANQGEAGIVELCEHLIGRGVGIEAGLLELADAHAFIDSGLADRCVRVLLEPLDAEPEAAVEHAAAMEDVLAGAGVGLEQVHHGDGVASWAVSARALARGSGIRTGLEDTTVLEDGRLAADNAELVRAAAAMVRGSAAIACTLPREVLADRRRRWQAVRERAAIETARTHRGLRMTFRAEPGVAEELAALVKLERDCCAFADWLLDASPDHVVLDVSGDSTEAVAAVQALLR